MVKDQWLFVDMLKQLGIKLIKEQMDVLDIIVQVAVVIAMTVLVQVDHIVVIIAIGVKHTLKLVQIQNMVLILIQDTIIQIIQQFLDVDMDILIVIMHIGMEIRVLDMVNQF
jgi:hypothetical protein